MNPSKKCQGSLNYSVFKATSPVNILLWMCWIAFSAKFLLKFKKTKTIKDRSGSFRIVQDRSGSFRIVKDVQFQEGAGSFEGAVIDDGDLVTPQIRFNQIGKIPEESIGFNPHHEIIRQNPAFKSVK